MKKIALSFLVLLTFATVAFAKQVSTELVEADVPNNWETVVLDGGTFMSVGPAEGDIQVNAVLVLEELGSEYSAAQYKEAGTDMLTAYIPGIKILASESNWHIIEYQYNETALRQLQYFYTKGDRGFCLTFTASAENFSKNEKIFREIAASFKLK